MYRFYFTEHMIPGQLFLDHTNLFSPNDYQKNDKIIYKYFRDKNVKKNLTLEFRLKKIDEVLVTNYLLKDIEDIDLISEKHKTCVGI